MSVDAQSIAQMAHHLQHPPQDEVDAESPLRGTKRKAEEDQGGQQRARRNRYVSIACNECKRRKIKCNGQTPCQRCGNLNLECVYAPNCCSGFKESQEFKDMSAQIDMLQDQVNTLYDHLNHLRAQFNAQVQPPQQISTPIDPSLQSYSGHAASSSRAQPSPGAPRSPTQNHRPRASSQSQNRFKGPTSVAFNLGVAKTSLESMGITGQGEEDASGSGGVVTTDVTPQSSPLLKHGNQSMPTIHTDKDPIWSIPQKEALRLCRVYEDEMGLMYPILDVDQVVDYAVKLYDFMEAARRSGLMQQGMPGPDAIDDEDTNILKLVIATALTVEASGRSELGQKIFEYVQPAIDTMLLGAIGVKAIRMLALAAMYEFNRDNEGTSWRIIGLAARLCIELGLHRRETYDAMENESERSGTVLLFWSIYVLDRRWSFGTGMPFALQDSDLDPQLPKPEDKSPYLGAMIQYSGIASKVWKSVAAPAVQRGAATINVDEMNYLDYQVIQWHRNIPLHLRFEHPSSSAPVSTTPGPSPSRAAVRLRILLYLRANQMRILIHRPLLHSATSILQFREQAQTAVDVAKDTIRVLTHVNTTSNIYSTQQITFNAFLTSALAVLFLAVSHTPAAFASDVREEFYMALDLVRGFSKGSWVSKRLWKTIRVLKDVGPQLGLMAKESSAVQQKSSAPEDPDPNRSAAVAMAGLAGVNVDEMALYHDASHSQHWSMQAGASSSPENMVHDLTSLFEAAGGFDGMSVNGHGRCGPSGVPMENGFAGIPDEGLNHILKELF